MEVQEASSEDSAQPRPEEAQPILHPRRTCFGRNRPVSWLPLQRVKTPSRSEPQWRSAFLLDGYSGGGRVSISLTSRFTPTITGHLCDDIAEKELVLVVTFRPARKP